MAGVTVNPPSGVLLLDPARAAVAGSAAVVGVRPAVPLLFRGGPAAAGTAVALVPAGTPWGPLGGVPVVEVTRPGWTDPDPCGSCQAFERVWVDHLTRGATRVEWALAGHVELAGPVAYQLQAAEAAAGDWVDAALPVTDAFEALDVERRFDGMQLTTHYRVVAKDVNGLVVRSRPVPAVAGGSFRDWLIAREIAREHRLRLTYQGGSRGYLLKRLRHGTPCTDCRDPNTGDVTNSRCPECYGVGLVGGYHPAVPCVFADLDYAPAADEIGPPTGMTNTRAATGLVLASPLLSTGDVWVDAATDERWRADTIKVSVRQRSIPVLLAVTLYLLDPTGVVYEFPVGD